MFMSQSGITTEYTRRSCQQEKNDIVKRRVRPPALLLEIEAKSPTLNQANIWDHARHPHIVYYMKPSYRNVRG